MNTWLINTKDYLKSLNLKLQENEVCKNLYYGFEILDGKLIQNPEILFIGINPGKGGEVKHFDVKTDSDRISYLDYLDNEYNYPLAASTVKVFRTMGFTDTEIVSYFENKVVKTNLFHIITESEKDIKKCFSQIGSQEFGNYFNKSMGTAFELIKSIQPKIVVCEGKSVFQNLVEVCIEKYGTWERENGFGYYFAPDLNTHFIGYSRRFSDIIEIDNFANKLKELIS